MMFLFNFVLGVVFICIGFFSLDNLNFFWSREVKFLRARGIKLDSLERTPEWDRRHMLSAWSFVLAGFISVAFAIWG